MPKTCCFSTSIFWGLGLDFGGLGPQLGSQVSHFGLQKLGTELFFYLLKLSVFSKWRLGGLRARF